jgi:hypothetical protein
MYYASRKLIDIALSYVGYLEKKNNNDLDSFIENAGRNNYTRFCRDYEKYTQTKGFQPSYWCAEYVSCCVVEAFGLEAAKELLCGDLFASCTIGRDRFKAKGQFHTENPLPGDIVMFYNSKRTGLAHCGLVTQVTGAYIHTCEGNTSSGKDVVVDNGGAVAEKVYKLTNPRIAGYCRMALDGHNPTLPAVKNRAVARFQDWLNSVGSYGLAIDGVCGKATKKAATKCLQQYLNERYSAGLEVDGIFGPQTKKCAPTIKIGFDGTLVYLLQGLLACYGYTECDFDGLFGLRTERSLIGYQRNHLRGKFSKHNICDANTWEKLLK